MTGNCFSAQQSMYIQDIGCKRTQSKTYLIHEGLKCIAFGTFGGVVINVVNSHLDMKVYR